MHKILCFLLLLSLCACSPKPTLSDEFDLTQYQQKVEQMRQDPEQNPEDLDVLERFFASPDFKAEDYRGQSYRDVVREGKKYEIRKARSQSDQSAQ